MTRGLASGLRRHPMAKAKAFQTSKKLSRKMLNRGWDEGDCSTGDIHHHHHHKKKSKDQGIIKRIAGHPPIHKASSSLDVDGIGLISFARCGLRIGL